MTSAPRRGAALILALIILAALLLLGLPFLFSQSAALTGTKSYAHHLAATTARDGVEAVAIAAAGEANANHWTVGGPDQHTDLRRTLIAAGHGVDAYPPDPDRVALATSITKNVNQPDTATVGATIEDESGKLDVNALSPRAWFQLLQNVLGGGADWDDGSAYTSRGWMVGPPAQYQWNDDDDIGELATALATLRFKKDGNGRDLIPGQRLTSLEQLLLADPGHNVTAAPATPGSPPSSPPGGSFGLRVPLTRAELEKLRPFLTVHNLGQARGGVLDLGTVAFVDSGANQSQEPVLDSVALQPSSTQGTLPNRGPNQIVGEGTAITAYRPSAPDLRIGGVAKHVDGPGLDDYEFNYSTTTFRMLQSGDLLGISVPADVNLNVVGDTIRRDIYFHPIAPANPFISLVGSQSPLPPVPGLGIDQVTIGTNILSASRFENPFCVDAISGHRAYELPPLGIVSLGIVTIDSSATVADAAGHQSAQRRRRTVAQAVPQEVQLERRWNRESTIDQAIRARDGSRVVAWPKPTPRLDDLLPDDVDATTGALADQAVGLRPAPLPTLDDVNVAPHLAAGGMAATWTRTFTGASDPAAATGFTANGLQSGAADADSGIQTTQMMPDGLSISSGISWATAGPFPPAPTSTDGEMALRHVALWIRAKAWTGRVPIVDLRAPTDNLGLPYNGTLNKDANGNPSATKDGRGQPSTDFQNLWHLEYNGADHNLVLMCANAAIEHTVDLPIGIGDDDPATPLDERAFGGARSLAPRRPLNAITTFYRIDLQPNRWYLLQVAYAGTRPDRQAIVVDGLVGRDLLHAPRGGANASDLLDKTGDHCTWPCLRLAEQLIADANETKIQRTIKVRIARPTASATIADMLPASGMIRIDDEYISYLSITGGPGGEQLNGCVRGRRQETIIPTSSTTPAVQPHEIGAMVVPGGYRLTHRNFKVRKGGCTLDGAWTNSPDNTNNYDVWATLGADLTATVMSVTLTTPHGAFPQRGFVMIDTEILYYENSSAGASTLTILNRGALSTTATGHLATVTNVVLISIAVTGNPNDDDRYATTGPYTQWIQLYDTVSAAAPAKGRVEWVAYTDAVYQNAHGYFVDRLGFPFPARRGLQRTLFSGDPTTTLGNIPWPSGARVLPVNAPEGPDASCYICATGDVVSFVPNGVAGNAFQAVVRYRPEDDFVNNIDVKNHYFALTEELPQAYDMMQWDLVAWPGWNGGDLSPTGGLGDPICGVRELLPNTKAWTFGTDPGRLYIGKEDGRADRSTSTAKLDGAIDAVVVGQMPDAAQTAVVDSTSATVDGVTAPFDLVTRGDVFLQPYGLVAIGGEVFAYHRDAGDPQGQHSVHIIARGLLGSARTPHVDGEAVIPLPLGPVGVLKVDLAAGDGPKKFEVDPETANVLSAPAMLLCQRNVDAVDDADAFEVVVAPRQASGGTWGASTPWLRGMYNSDVGSWTAAGSLAIGWYPRFASAFPNTASAPAIGARSAFDPYSRCRSYAWATFPLRLYDIDLANGAVDIDVIDDSAGHFDLKARGSGHAFNDFGAWSSWHSLSVGSNNVAATLADIQAEGPQPDGVEVRVGWAYRNATSGKLVDLADCGDRAPMIGQVKIAVHAPSEVIAVEESR